MNRFALCMKILALFTLGVTANAQESPKVLAPKLRSEFSQHDIDSAKLKVQQSNSKLKTIEKLARRGSATSTQLDKARLDKQIAELELDSLLNPDRAKVNRLELAKLKAQAAKEWLVKCQKLYSVRSISKLQLRRADYRYQAAILVLRHARGDISVDIANLETAKLDRELLRTEFRLAEKLLHRKSLTREEFEQVQSKLHDAELKVEDLEKRQNQKRSHIDHRIKT